MGSIARFSLGAMAASILLMSTVTFAAECPTDRVIFCYYSSWAMYRPSLGRFNVSMIDPQLCTHMVYAFAGLDLNGYTLALDAYNDLPESGGAGQYYMFRQLREENPCLKIMLSIGGWGEGSEKFSVMAESPESRSRFVEHLLRYLIYYGFDGVDIDWEYPTQRGGIKDDRDNFVKLLTEIKARLGPRNRLVATAVGAASYLLEDGYDVKNLGDAVDYVLLMAYDYHLSSKTSHVAPLYKKAGDIHPTCVDDSVQAWLAGGLPANKLVLGVLSSGRSYTLTSASSHDLGADAIGVGNAGPYTGSEGFISFYEMCDQMLDDDGWISVVDLEVYASAYAYNDDQWVTYENPKTILAKATYAYEKSLAGVMLWSIDTDDFRGLCGPRNRLHNAIREGLKFQ